MNKLLEALRLARLTKRRVFICGNGGSASTAEHFSNDLFSKGVRAFCLNSNVSIITMIANDFGYPFIYSQQLALYADKGDILITLSCSGTSGNIINAIEVAKELGMQVYEFESSKDKFNIDYERLEDRHLILAHQIKKAL